MQFRVAFCSHFSEVFLATVALVAALRLDEAKAT